jgi:hypothetical protein
MCDFYITVVGRTVPQQMISTAAEARDLDGFAREVEAFLDANATRRDKGAVRGSPTTAWGEDTDDVSIFEDVASLTDEGLLTEARAWQQKRFDTNFGWIKGPPHFGGRGLPSAFTSNWSGRTCSLRVTSSTP